MYAHPELPPLPDIEPDVFEIWWYAAGRYSWHVHGCPEETVGLAMPFQMVLVQVEDVLRSEVEEDAFLLDLARKQFTRGWKDRREGPAR